jgi:hypothetical protein
MCCRVRCGPEALACGGIAAGARGPVGVRRLAGDRDARSSEGDGCAGCGLGPLMAGVTGPSPVQGKHWQPAPAAPQSSAAGRPSRQLHPRLPPRPVTWESTLGSLAKEQRWCGRRIADTAMHSYLAMPAASAWTCSPSVGSVGQQPDARRDPASSGLPEKLGLPEACPCADLGSGPFRPAPVLSSGPAFYPPVVLSRAWPAPAPALQRLGSLYIHPTQQGRSRCLARCCEGSGGS